MADSHDKRGLLCYRTSVLLVALSVLWACAKDWSDPRAVVTRYLTATYEQDLKEVYAHLSSEDQAFQSLETFTHYNSTEDSIVVGPLMRRTTFEIETLEMDGDRGRAVVRVKQPNIDRVMGDLFGAALSSIGSGKSPGQFDKLLKKRYGSRPVPMITVKRGVGLVREGVQWKISAGWPQEERVGALVQQASYLEESGNLKEAKKKYEEAFALNEDLIEIQDKIDAIDFRMMPAAEAQRESRKILEQALEDLQRGRTKNRP